MSDDITKFLAAVEERHKAVDATVKQYSRLTDYKPWLIRDAVADSEADVPTLLAMVREVRGLHPSVAEDVLRRLAREAMEKNGE